MNKNDLQEYKAGQRQGAHDFFNGPHKRFEANQGPFTEGLSMFGAGYVQAYDTAEAETNHQENKEDYFN